MSALTFRPTRRQIQSISNAVNSVITTTEPHGYLPGLYIRVQLPNVFGMEQLNNQVFLASDITLTSFSIGTDTRTFTPFVTGIANISAIQNTNPANVIVTSAQFLPGQQVLINGITGPMDVLNGKYFNVLTVQFGTLVTINVDTSGFPLYIGGGIIQVAQAPQVIPVAEISATLQNAEKNNLTPIGGP